MDKTPLITACAESGALVSRQKDGLGARRKCPKYIFDKELALWGNPKRSFAGFDLNHPIGGAQVGECQRI